ncbi:hypothetical protein ACGFH8_31105 [Micromonospora sp. NPDC049175]|uniref:hypothetical protein n=1 Tax=Micromonospora sp. NPDC049175 TaxID=3364266 RepID=UPI0037173952
MLVAVRGITLAAKSGVVVKTRGGYGGVLIRLGEGVGNPLCFCQVHRSAGSVARLDPREQQPPLLVVVTLSGSVVGVALLR